MRTVGDNIRSLRNAKGMTQTGLGKKCGMADSQVGAYERNECVPRKRNIERIAVALGVSAKDIAKEENKNEDD